MHKYEKIQKHQQGGIVQAQVAPESTAGPNINPELYSQAYMLPEVQMPEVDTDAIAKSDANLIDKQSMLNEIASTRIDIERELRSNPAFLDSQKGKKMLATLQNLTMYGSTQLKTDYDRTKKQLDYIGKEGHGSNLWSHAGNFLAVVNGELKRVTVKEAHERKGEKGFSLLTNEYIAKNRAASKVFDDFIEGIGSSGSMNTVTENILKKSVGMGYEESGGDSFSTTADKALRVLAMNNIENSVSYVKHGYKNKNNKAAIAKVKRAVQTMMSIKDRNTINAKAYEIATSLGGDMTFEEKMDIAEDALIMDIIDAKRINSNITSVSAHKGPRAVDGKVSDIAVQNVDLNAGSEMVTVYGTNVGIGNIIPNASYMNTDKPDSKKATTVGQSDLGYHLDFENLVIPGIDKLTKEERDNFKEAGVVTSVKEVPIATGQDGKPLGDLIKDGSKGENLRAGIRLGALAESVKVAEDALKDGEGTAEDVKSANEAVDKYLDSIGGYKGPISYGAGYIGEAIVPVESRFFSPDVLSDAEGEDIDSKPLQNRYNNILKNSGMTDEDGGFTEFSDIKSIKFIVPSTRGKTSWAYRQYNVGGATGGDLIESTPTVHSSNTTFQVGPIDADGNMQITEDLQ